MESIKVNKKIRNTITKALKGSSTDLTKARTIPELADETQLDMKSINYQLATMRKYGLAEEIPERNKEFLKWRLKEK